MIFLKLNRCQIFETQLTEKNSFKLKNIKTL